MTLLMYLKNDSRCPCTYSEYHDEPSKNLRDDFPLTHVSFNKCGKIFLSKFFLGSRVLVNVLQPPLGLWGLEGYLLICLLILWCKWSLSRYQCDIIQYSVGRYVQTSTPLSVDFAEEI